MNYFFVLYRYPMPMQLMMYIGNDLIEAVPLQREGLRQPGYLGKFKRHLKMKYSELISQSPQPPDFLVFEPAPPVPVQKDK